MNVIGRWRGTELPLEAVRRAAMSDGRKRIIKIEYGPVSRQIEINSSGEVLNPANQLMIRFNNAELGLPVLRAGKVVSLFADESKRIQLCGSDLPIQSIETKVLSSCAV